MGFCKAFFISLARGTTPSQAFAACQEARFDYSGRWYPRPFASKRFVQPRSEAHMMVGVPKEIVPGERRVALVPELVPKLTRMGVDVLVQAGAGAAAGFLDPTYAEQGARVDSE